MTKQCKCGRPVTAGYTAGGTGTDWCLICTTARVMRTFTTKKKPAKQESNHEI